VLQVDPERAVYVRRQACGVDTGLLPNTLLHLEAAWPLGFIAAQARGPRLESIRRISLGDENLSLTCLPAELVPFDCALDAVADDLANAEDGRE
jgi:hypothetical protein